MIFAIVIYAVAMTTAWEDAVDTLDGAEQAKDAAEDAELMIEVFHLGEGDEPFICAVHGKVTIEALQQIAAEFEQEDYFPHGPGNYRFQATHFAGQYGFEGRCELAPGWELSEVGFKPLEEQGAARAAERKAP